MTGIDDRILWIGSSGDGNVADSDRLQEGFEGAHTADFRLTDIVAQKAGPWYWYVPVQQPLCWSLRGFFQLLPNFPEVVVFAGDKRPFPGLPIPQVGFASLADAILNGQADILDFEAQSVPNGGFDNLKGSWGLLGPGGDEGLGSPMTQPPQSQSIPPWSTELAEGFGGFVPNIWQLVNLPQPPLKNPALPWNPLTNPYTAPAPDLATKAAQTFAKFWNDASNSLNQYEETRNALQLSAAQVAGGDAVIQIGAPPEWEFNTPFIDIAGGLGQSLNFNAGNPIGIFKFAPVELPAATALVIAVDRLDPNVWDTSSFPPVQWSLTHPHP